MTYVTMHHFERPEAAQPQFAELSVVALVRGHETDDGLAVPVGTEGTVVAVWGGGAAYEVEFAEPVVGNATIPAADLRVA